MRGHSNLFVAGLAVEAIVTKGSYELLRLGKWPLCPVPVWKVVGGVGTKPGWLHGVAYEGAGGKFNGLNPGGGLTKVGDGRGMNCVKGLGVAGGTGRFGWYE